METFRDLNAWKEAIKLAKLVYQETRNFPKTEMFGLTSQIRRAAVSIPSNIAEGNGRLTPKEYLRFLSIANGSQNELATQLVLAEMLGYLETDKLNLLTAQLNTVGKLITGLRRSLEQPGAA
ncbi:MAG: four helix bundle protein [Treponema sp.]|nr:four helix bundle protein [Treponema sp.]